MNVRTKTILILVITFMAGGILGVLVSGTLRRHHLNRIVRLREPQGFVGFTEQVLKPTQTQKDTVQKILLENHKRISELRERNMRELSALMDSLQLRLAQVLTKDQMKRFSQLQRRMPPRPRDGFPPFPMMGAPDELLNALQERLRLSDDQIKKIQTILSDMHGPGGGGPEWGGEDPSKRFKAMQGRMDSLEARISAVLTPEQKAEFAKFRLERKGKMAPFNPQTMPPPDPPPDRR
jgi:hypothetical protein